MANMVGIIDARHVVTTDIPRPDKSVIDGYLALKDHAGVVSRALDQFGIRGSIPSATLRPSEPNSLVVGPAITVRNVPEQWVAHAMWSEETPTRLGEREAFFLSVEGDIVVIDGQTVFPASCLGSMSAKLASRLGVRGIIVAGAVTGVAGIRSSGLPVWSMGGTTVTGHHRAETIEINGPIGVCGVRVNPGDLVVADDSGVAVVPAASIESVLRRAEAMLALGSHLRKLIDDGAAREQLRVELGKQMAALSRSSGGGSSDK